MTTTVEGKIEVLPNDKHNRELVQNVHPPDWVNPEPAKRYNMVVVGAGTAGLVTAAGVGGLGGKVALVERYLMGGDCLNYGCVPSKCIIRSSRVVGEVLHAKEFGIDLEDGASADFGEVMERMRRLRTRISSHDSAKRFSEEYGVDVYMGQASFTGMDTVEAAGKTLRFKKAVIAAGARPVQPDIEGLAEAGFLTNENVFTLTERPARLVVIGAGPIGCELSQAFRRLGSQVTLIQRSGQFLKREDPDAAAILADRFRSEGIEVLLNTSTKRVEVRDGKKVLYVDVDGSERQIEADQILVGLGRTPNIEGLGLEHAGVGYNKYGVVVNDKLQTSNPNIYAAGDVCSRFKFTHIADFAARIAIQNALFPGSKKFSALTIPWCTYTNPEIAHVGMYEKDAKKAGIEVDTYVRKFEEVDRAITDGEEEGFVKIHVKKGSDKIIGATIVASHAGDMISEITLAIAGKIGLGRIANVIHPYPTQAEAIRQLGDAYNRTRLTPLVKRLFKWWLALRR
jgi:pyruvate/2-oxoglutarate dehydrogenase complex dihydrolipoamide dehydrogenase (E3) component